MTPDSWFSASPRWGWLIALYFFVGGIAGGALFLSSLLHFFSRPQDRPLVRLGHYVALAGAVVSGALLTLDLTKPLRFWHMLIEANAGAPVLKPWSPMSVGAWALIGFSAVAALATLGSLAEEGRPRWSFASGLARGIPGFVIAVGGAVSGLFLAGYTGVLLSVTNRPLWADSHLLGLLFLFSGVSTAAASLVLLSRRGRGPTAQTLGWLMQFDSRVLVLELATLLAFLFSLGPLVKLLRGWTWLLLVGVIGLGIVLPWILERRRGTTDTDRAFGAPALVLLGGLLMRIVVIFSSEQMSVVRSTVAGS